MILSMINLFAMLVILITLVLTMYFVMSVREQICELRQAENHDIRKRTIIQSKLESNNSQNFKDTCSSSSTSGSCNRPEPMEHVTRVPSPKRFRKRFQGLSQRLRSRRKNCSTPSKTSQDWKVALQSSTSNITFLAHEKEISHIDEGPSLPPKDFPQYINRQRPDEHVVPVLPLKLSPRNLSEQEFNRNPLHNSKYPKQLLAELSCGHSHDSTEDVELHGRGRPRHY